MKIIYLTILNSYLLYGDPALAFAFCFLVVGLTLAWKMIDGILGL